MLSESTIAGMLTKALDLQQQPVAVCFTDAKPAALAGPKGRVAAGCRFWQDAADGALATSAADHSTCAIGVYHPITWSFLRLRA